MKKQTSKEPKKSKKTIRDLTPLEARTSKVKAGARRPNRLVKRGR